MKILFYGTRNFERPYFEKDDLHHELHFTSEPLSLASCDKARGFDAISIAVADNASSEVLKRLYEQGIHQIAVRAAGYDNIDINQANQLGFKVANVPQYSPYAIAEHAVALILALNRKIVSGSKQLPQHNFSIDRLVGFDLHDKTVGIIGTGRIGSVFAKIMHGFGCRLLGYDLEENKILTTKYDLEYVELPALCSSADIISLHTCLTEDTTFIINRTLLDGMKKGVMIINTARGKCIKTIDIIEGLDNGSIGYYGADVYENEKDVFFHDLSATNFQDPMLEKLLSMSNVLITPHQAFATVDALNNIADTTFYNLNCWGRHQPSMNELTTPSLANINH